MANSNGTDFLIDKQPFQVEADWDDLTEEAQDRITAEFIDSGEDVEGWDHAQDLLKERYLPLYSLPLER